jgi:inhibitor of KinA
VTAGPEHSRPLRIVDAGDSAVVAELGDRIDIEVNAHVVALAGALAECGVPGIRDVVPTYKSVAVHFDPLTTPYEALVEAIHFASDRVWASVVEDGDLIRIPVCYEAEFGIDLQAVARIARMSEAEVAAVHARQLYRVFMLGFAPGFAYMSSVDDRIAVPRHASPRLRVPSGSVGIADRQTGVYPADLPGGWHIIGRTPVRLFRPGASDPFLLKPGDNVKFYAITRDEFDRWPSM